MIITKYALYLYMIGTNVPVPASGDHVALYSTEASCKNAILDLKTVRYGAYSVCKQLWQYADER
jgi:hypothetical protein